MDQESSTKLKETAEALDRLISLGRTIVGGVASIAVAIAGIAIWVNSTNGSIRQTQDDLRHLMDQRSESLRDWQAWRSENDKTIARITTILENQQREIEHLRTK